MYKVIGADGKEYGPVSADQLRQWVTEGRANAQTRVRPEGGTEWSALSALPEFAALFPGTPAPLAPGAPPPVSTDAAQQVSGPAIGLIATAIIGFIAQAISLAANLAGASFLASSHQMPNERITALMSGTVGVVTGAIAILLSGVILYGALKMKKLESHSLAMVSSIIAIIPCISPCCIIGLPIGIWALVVLMKPEVKNAFH